MYDIAKIILELDLGYDIDYAVINLENDEIKKTQKEFFDFLTKRKNDNLITSLEESDIKKRIYTDDILPSAKSMIILLFPYITPLHDENGNLSLYCMGEDYHIYVRKYLNLLVEKLKSVKEKSNFYTQVDTGSLNERFFAFYSGVGKLGLNSMIISEKYGSYINIGLIVSDIYIAEKRYQRSYCDKCMACIKSCPGLAINGDFSIDSSKCASYISQKKGELSTDEKNIIKKSKKIFGCDICQNVCHFNHNVKNILESYDIIKNINIEDINHLSNKKFKEKYKDRAFSFRGKSVIERNIKCLGEDIE